jgi:hypothetical protein
VKKEIGEFHEVMMSPEIEELERMRSLVGDDGALALYDDPHGEAEKGAGDWQGAVNEAAVEIAQLRALLHEDE